MESEGRRGKVWKWWPHHVLTLAAVMLTVVFLVGWLADLYPVPDDAPEEIPIPDHGANVPGPEWLFLLFWQPFWYFVGIKQRYLALMPVIPILLGVFFVFLPYFHKIPLGRIPGLGPLLARARSMRTGLLKSFVYAVPTLLFAAVFFIGVYESGHEAKVLGCDACHNPAMGHRMAVPPTDVARYYSVERARQIESATYRAGKVTGRGEGGELQYDLSGGDEGGYKDANWQMRHMYEPTFTW